MNILVITLISFLALITVPALALGGVLLGASLLGRWQDARSGRQPPADAIGNQGEGALDELRRAVSEHKAA